MFRILKINRVARIHIAVWFLYTLYFAILITYYESNISVLKFFAVLSFYRLGDIIFFYTNSLYVLPKFLNSKKVPVLIISFISLLSLYLAYRYLFDYYIFPKIGLQTRLPLNESIAIGISQGGNFIIFSLGYYFAQRVIQQQKEIAQRDITIAKKDTEIANQKAIVAEQQLVLIKKEKELAEERERNAILAKEKAQAEMAFLRAQINPHFLYNTLNLIYGKVLNSTKEVASDLILEFSDMMRYATGAKMQEDTVDLSGELNFVKGYLKMFKARNQQNANIDYEEEGYFGSHRVVPMVLITLIENALKHGLVDDPNHPLVVRVSMEDDFFVFMVRNLKNPKPESIMDRGNTGVGVVNIIKRLNAVYKKGGFTLESEDLKDDYIATFTVNYKII